MSFLNQLKSQANALQTQQVHNAEELAANTQATEMACKTVWHYLNELCKHLNVIAPAGPEFAVGKNAVWPLMKLVDFRLDARKKMLRDREVFDTISVGWHILPLHGQPSLAKVDVDFVPELERVIKNLSAGGVKFEQKDVVQPDKKPKQLIRFEYMTQARGFVTVTTDHDNAQLNFRLANTTGFGIKNVVWPAERMQSEFLDELAKLIVAQPSRFVVEAV